MKDKTVVLSSGEPLYLRQAICKRIDKIEDECCISEADTCDLCDIGSEIKILDDLLEKLAT